jgi:hypothetical protein
MAMGKAFRSWLSAPIEGTAAPPAAPTDPRLPLLVVGAGPAGLAGLSALSRAGVACEGIEAHSQVGGIWDATNPVSTVYEGLRTVTSRFTSHLGPPMPADWPNFPSHEKVHEYFLRFAREQGLLDKIQLSTRFESARKTDRGTWLATLRRTSDGSTHEREVRGLVFATGSHNTQCKKVPQDLAQQAAAAGIEVLHSADYKRAAPFAGKRVLVVGIGNSGSDIAEKVSAVAGRTLLSIRTMPWINPEVALGKPCDKLGFDSAWMPHWFQMASFSVIRRLHVPHPRRLGMTIPRHHQLYRLAVSDRGIVKAILDKKVTVRSHVAGFENGQVLFDDPQHSPEPIDVAIFATGFGRKYPLLDETGAHAGKLHESLSFLIFHRREPGLAYLAEAIGTRGCWPIFVEQAQAIAAYYKAEERGGQNVDAFNARRMLPSPDFKGPVFDGSDGFHMDYGIYTRALRDLSAWLTK